MRPCWRRKLRGRLARRVGPTFLCIRSYFEQQELSTVDFHHTQIKKTKFLEVSEDLELLRSTPPDERETESHLGGRSISRLVLLQNEVFYPRLLLFSWIPTRN
jgi:hypothetical protein